MAKYDIQKCEMYHIESTSDQLRQTYQEKQVMALTKLKPSNKITNMVFTVTHDTKSKSKWISRGNLQYYWDYENMHLHLIQQRCQRHPCNPFENSF